MQHADNPHLIVRNGVENQIGKSAGRRHAYCWFIGRLGRLGKYRNTGDGYLGGFAGAGGGTRIALNEIVENVVEIGRCSFG